MEFKLEKILGFRNIQEKLENKLTSFKSQILIIESEVPVPKIKPSGWTWAQVRAELFSPSVTYKNHNNFIQI